MSATIDLYSDGSWIGSLDIMASAERAWLSFSDKNVEEDECLKTLAAVLIVTYTGDHTFLKNVKSYYSRYKELTTKQSRAVLNFYIRDTRFAVPLAMYLNFGFESPSGHILTKSAIIDFAMSQAKKKAPVVETLEITNPFSFITMDWIEDEFPTTVDTSGRIFPGNWKVNLHKKRSSTSDARGQRPHHSETYKAVHGIHTDSWIKDNQMFLVTYCGLYRTVMPDPFEIYSFTTDEVDCNKCISKKTLREG